MFTIATVLLFTLAIIYFLTQKGVSSSMESTKLGLGRTTESSTRRSAASRAGVGTGPKFDFKLVPPPMPSQTPPTSLSTLRISNRQWRDLECKKYYESLNMRQSSPNHIEYAAESHRTRPRFLLRSFSARSGGGYRGLNRTDGITPLAFLETSLAPKTMYELPDLRHNIQHHLSNSSYLKTYFSSWATEFETIMGFAVEHKQGHIAIIDTALLPDPVSIYYSPHLQDYGLSGLSYAQEYLACGPIAGHAYHCVKLSDIKTDLTTLGWYNGRLSDYHGTGALSRITADHVEAARRIAKRFRRPDDNRPGVVLFVTVTLLSNSARILPSSRSHIVDLLIKGLRDELRIYCWLTSGNGSLGLANPATPATSQPLVRLTLDLLTAMAQRITSDGRV